MMGREARELMLSGRGEQGLQLFKARAAPVSSSRHRSCVHEVASLGAT